MDEMSRRIKENTHLLRRYLATNGQRLHGWGLTSGEMEAHIHSATWQSLLYRDETPDDELCEYQL